MEAGASESDAESSCSSHPAIKSVLIRMLLVIYIGVCVLFFLKLLGIFYSCLDNHQRKREGGGPKDVILTGTTPEDDTGFKKCQGRCCVRGCHALRMGSGTSAVPLKPETGGGGDSSPESRDNPAPGYKVGESFQKSTCKK